MEGVPRPVAQRSVVERARAWVAWFGVGRLAVSAISVVVVCAGAWFLVRSPPPPNEASLPRAGASSTDVTVPPVTLEPPDSDRWAPVVVHVAGAVSRPGVYELPDGARVRDAVESAGGPVGDADTDALNLAALVADGSRVYVPKQGEAVPVLESGPSGGSRSDIAIGPIDVNVATVAELESLPGIGPATAAAIVTERERNGPFLGVDDLERVPGIGPAKLDRIRELVVT